MARVSSVALALWIASASTLLAQQRPADGDSSQILTTLRAFYFNLAHKDWEAMAADVLPAKVVAHRPTPEALTLAARSTVSDEPRRCVSKASPMVEDATITLDGDWAEVSVPWCIAAPAATDEFRLIHFEQRWRFVYIDLFEPPANVSADR